MGTNTKRGLVVLLTCMDRAVPSVGYGSKVHSMSVDVV